MYPKRKTTEVEADILLETSEEVWEHFKESEIEPAKRRVNELNDVRIATAQLKNGNLRYHELEYLHVQSRLGKGVCAPGLSQELHVLEAPEHTAREALECAKSCLSVAETRRDIATNQAHFFVGKREGFKAAVRHLSAIVADPATASTNLIKVMGQVMDDGEVDKLITTLARKECRSLNGGYLYDEEERRYDFDISSKEGVEVTEGGVQIFGGRVLYVPGASPITLPAVFPDLDARYDPEADVLIITVGEGTPGPGKPDEVESRLTLRYGIVNKRLVDVTIRDFVKNTTRWPLWDRLEKNLKGAKEALDAVAAAESSEKEADA